MEKYAIIVAGGSGKRMQTKLPKQFVEVKEKPILMHTIEVFFHFCKEIQIILVLPKEQQNHWLELVKKHNFNIPHILAEGGSERFYSVKNGLKFVKNESENLVAVHDGVRPLVSKETINNCFSIAKDKGSAIPVMPISVSLRKVEEHTSQSLDRSKYVAVQTPQVFRADWLQSAYNQCFSEKFTDDASVLEKYGYPIHLAEGNQENIKITYQQDLYLAEILLSKSKM